MGFGQYAHLTYGQVLRRHPDYLDWAEDQPGLDGPLADWVGWCHGQESASVEHSDGSEDSSAAERPCGEVRGSGISSGTASSSGAVSSSSASCGKPDLAASRPGVRPTSFSSERSAP